MKIRLFGLMVCIFVCQQQVLPVASREFSSENSLNNYDDFLAYAQQEEASSLTSLTLNVAASNLGDKGIEALVDGLAKLTSLTSLDLNVYGNNLGVEGITALANGLAKLTSLTSLTLNVSENKLGVEGITALANGLEKLMSLTSLKLLVGFNKLGVESITALANGLEKLMSLTSLKLLVSGNNLGVEGITALVDGLARLTSLTSLMLNVRFNKLGDKGIEVLADGLEKLTSLTSLTLDVSGNNLGVEGITALVDGLARFTSLTSLTLDVRGNNLGDEGITALVDGLARLTSLTSLTLDVGENYLIFVNMPLQPFTRFTLNSQVVRETVITKEAFDAFPKDLQHDLVFYLSGRVVPDALYQKFIDRFEDPLFQSVHRAHEERVIGKFEYVHEAAIHAARNKPECAFVVVEDGMRTTIKDMLFELSPTTCNGFLTASLYQPLKITFAGQRELGVDVGGVSRRFFNLMSELLVPIISNEQGDKLIPQSEDARERVIFLNACKVYGKLLAYAVLNQKYPFGARLHPYILFMIMHPLKRDNFYQYKYFAKVFSGGESFMAKQLRDTFFGNEESWNNVLQRYEEIVRAPVKTEDVEVPQKRKAKRERDLATEEDSPRKIHRTEGFSAAAQEYAENVLGAEKEDFDDDILFKNYVAQRLSVDLGGAQALRDSFVAVINSVQPDNSLFSAVSVLDPAQLSALWPSAINPDFIGVNINAFPSLEQLKVAVDEYVVVEPAESEENKKRFLSKEEAQELKDFITDESHRVVIKSFEEALDVWLKADETNRSKFVQEFSGAGFLAAKKTFQFNPLSTLTSTASGQAILFSVHTCSYSADLNSSLLLYLYWKSGSIEAFKQHLKQDIFPNYFGGNNKMNIG